MSLAYVIVDVFTDTPLQGRLAQAIRSILCQIQSCSS
jgi:hypothetical protein